MYYNLLPVPLSVFLIILYARARKRNDLRTVAIVQPVGTAVSLVIVALSLLTPNADTSFTLWILAGMILCLIGDVNNVDMTNEKTVMIGLVIFVFAYLTYAVGLTVMNGFHKQDIIAGMVLILAYVAFIASVWSGLDGMHIPVPIYGLVITFMVSRAVSTFFGSTFSLVQAILLTVGTTMIFLGDVEYGIHRFRKPIPMHFGPYLYAGGQLLVALSPSYFR